MSIATEISRIQNAKTAIKAAINARGGTITNELLDQYAPFIVNLSPTGRVAYVIDDNGTLKLQPLSFDGTTASNDGDPEVLDIEMFNLPPGVSEPDYGGGSGGADVTLGVVNANGEFVPFTFDGTTPSDGTPESVIEFKSWNSTLPSPTPPSGGMSDLEFFDWTMILENN